MSGHHIALAGDPSVSTLIKINPAEQGTHLTSALNAKPIKYSEKVSFLNLLRGKDQCSIGAKGDIVPTNFIDPVPWQLRLYHDAKTKKGRVLKGGDLIALLHENFEGYLTIPSENVGVIPHLHDRVVDVRLVVGNVEKVPDPRHANKHKTLCEHSWMFWEVIKGSSSRLDGSTCLVQEPVQLRHLVTGKFLVARDSSKSAGMMPEWMESIGSAATDPTNMLFGSATQQHTKHAGEGPRPLLAENEHAGHPPPHSYFMFTAQDEALDPTITLDGRSYFLELAHPSMVAQMDAKVKVAIQAEGDRDGPTVALPIRMGTNHITRDRFQLVAPEQQYEIDLYIAVRCMKEIGFCFPQPTISHKDLEMQLDRCRKKIIPRLMRSLVVPENPSKSQVLVIEKRQRMLRRLGLIDNCTALCQALLEDVAIMADDRVGEAARSLMTFVHKALRLMFQRDKLNMRQMASKADELVRQIGNGIEVTETLLLLFDDENVVAKVRYGKLDCACFCFLYIVL